MEQICTQLVQHKVKSVFHDLNASANVTKYHATSSMTLAQWPRTWTKITIQLRLFCSRASEWPFQSLVSIAPPRARHLHVFDALAWDDVARER